VKDLRIQIGAERISGSRRVVRMTPVDKTVRADDDVADVVLLVVGVADAFDIQPGDGELDVRLGELPHLPDLKLLEPARPFLAALPGPGWNAFIRITAAS
jgi:hypothetical protein